MRRRKLFTLAAGAAAVLCVAVCVLWVRSYWVFDAVVEHDYSYLLASSRGGVVMAADWSARGDAEIKTRRRRLFYRRFPPSDPERAFLFAKHTRRVVGFVFSWTSEPRSHCFNLLMPDWFLAALFAVVPTMWTRHRIGRDSARTGLCPRCGYDL